MGNGENVAGAIGMKLVGNTSGARVDVLVAVNAISEGVGEGTNS